MFNDHEIVRYENINHDVMFVKMYISFVFIIVFFSYKFHRFAVNEKFFFIYNFPL